MAIPISVPRLGWTMEEGVFVGWLKKDGEEVKPGDLLYTLEGEKATQEVESMDGGILRIPPDAPQPGVTVVVGALLGYLTEPGESAPWETQAVQAVSRNQPRAAAPAVATEVPIAGPPQAAALATSVAEPAISPRARRVARELGIDWHGLRGGGRSGRIRERDVRATAAAAPASAGSVGRMTPVRKVIAERMARSAHTTAPVTLTTRADATNLVGLREQFKAAAEGPVPGYTDLIVKLTALLLRRHPHMNAVWRDDGVFVADAVHIAIAVDTDAGLLAPVLRDVASLTVRQVVDQSQALIEQARVQRLTVEQMQGGTFTVTNLGMHGIDAFTPIINLPQVAILGVGRITREPAVVNEQIVPRDMVALSLTFDHRAVDGGPAARFLDELRGAIEQPAAWLVA
jgi:pyruvate dehydrogenase E2 component (dihydrolipoamide acetyltransferase)